jgi:archaellum component FlaC
MDYSAAKFWFDVVQTVLIAVIGLQNWFGKRHAATEADIKALKSDIDSKLNAQAERLTRVEQDLEHAPGKEDFIRLHERMDDVKDDIGDLNKVIGTLQGGFDQVSRQLNDMINFLRAK